MPEGSSGICLLVYWRHTPYDLLWARRRTRKILPRTWFFAEFGPSHCIGKRLEASKTKSTGSAIASVVHVASTRVYEWTQISSLLIGPRCHGTCMSIVQTNVESRCWRRQVHRSKGQILGAVARIFNSTVQQRRQQKFQSGRFLGNSTHCVIALSSDLISEGLNRSCHYTCLSSRCCSKLETDLLPDQFKKSATADCGNCSNWKSRLLQKVI